jgi:hypothetical protein
MTKKKLFVVDTISSFRMRYVIEADELEHAYDEVLMRNSGDDKDSFEEMSQRYLGETILDGREITKKEFNSLLTQYESDENEISSYWMGEKLIRVVDYDEKSKTSS